MFWFCFLKKRGRLFNENTQTFDIKLPTSGVTVGLSLLDGESERFLSNNDKEKAITSMLNTFITKIFTHYYNVLSDKVLIT